MCSTYNAKDYDTQAYEIISPFLEADLFSGVVMVIKKGMPIFRRAFGLANREWAIPNTPETRFRIGSITKQFTAAAILRLAERGKLDVSHRLGLYLPDIPHAWSGVSIHQLLTHTSGVPSYTSLPDFLSHISLEERTPEQIVKLTSSHALEFPPGDRFSYSNTGYILLGMIVEKVSGHTYSAFLQDEFFQQLGMLDTSYENTSTIVSRRAAGYTCIDGKWRHARFIAMSLPYAAGGLYSTVDDLHRWSEALVKGVVVRPDLVMEMLRDHGHGYGWFIGSVDDRRIVSHGGAINGFLGTVKLYADDDVTVIVLSNLQGAEVLTIAERLAQACFGTYERRHEIALGESKLEEFVGIFQLGHRCFLKTFIDNGTLCVRLSGRQRLRLACSGPDAFFSKTSAVEITFRRRAQGNVHALELHEHDVAIVGLKVDEAVNRLPGESQAETCQQTLPASTNLEKYTGRYRLARMHLEVTLDGGQLLMQGTAQPGTRATLCGDSRFVLEDVQAEITFEHTKSGAVWGLTLHQAGLKLRAFKLFEHVATSCG